MTPERWQQIKAVLDTAVALSPPEREAYLASACAADPELRREVDSLLVSHEAAASGFLGSPLAARGVAFAVGGATMGAGTRIGPYLLREAIGRGGMGEVFAAVRADGQYEQRVALKLVRAGLSTPDVLERFRAERQILAGLDHPNIARLLDGGTTQDGVPYLVMELVDGAPIDVFCHDRGLTVRDRLRLFLQVCAAVQYAHQRLVIHRDLKPGNILVTRDGVPKLLDFGIAKMLDPLGSARETALRPLTLEYASPEQVRGEAVSTASDVYALGVVLYQLLTGRLPYDLERGTSAELAQAITGRDPDRPSVVAAQETGPGATPPRAQRELRGDIDVILLKALRKEPDKRYASAEQFADDIRRHLDGLPVTARTGTWSYTAGKFVRRHRAGVAAAALVLTTLVAGIVVTAREARVARRQAEIAGIQKARAEKRFNDVRELSDSLIFDVHDAIQSLPGATPARRLLLDRAVAYLDRVSSDAAGDPDLERELAWGYQRLAVVQGSPAESNVGDLNAALESDRKALTLFERVAAANPKDAIDQLNVAMMHRILAYSMLTKPDGRRHLDTAMGITERLLAQGITDPKVRSERAIEFQNLAFLQDASGDRTHALDAYRQNQALKLDILRTNPEYRNLRRGLGMASVLLGTALGRMGRREDALKSLDEGIGFYESLRAGNDAINVKRELAISWQKRGDVLLMDGDVEGALAVYRQSHAVLEPMAKADPENTMLQLDIAGMEYHEARALTGARKYDDAIPRLQRALGVFEKLHDPTRSADDSPRGPGSIYIWLGEAFAGRRELPAARSYFEKAIASLSRDLELSPDDDLRCDLAVSHTKLAAVLAAMGNRDAASSTYQKALAIVRVGAVPEHHDVPAFAVMADAYAGLGDLRLADARLDEARIFYDNSLNAWNEVPNPSRIGPTGYVAREPRDVAARLANLRKPDKARQ